MQLFEILDLNRYVWAVNIFYKALPVMEYLDHMNVHFCHEMDELTVPVCEENN